LEALVKNLRLGVEKTFLLPDNSRPGNLETLLEQMGSPDHLAVYSCLDDYDACRLKHQYRTLKPKARIYAYCEAVGAVTGLHKDYSNAQHWNADAPILKRLRQFLLSMAGSAQE